MKKKIWIFPLVFSVFVALIALVFHYTVHIENALTLQPEPGFAVQSNIWRTVFEPVLGVLLYFNRTFYGVKELTNLLYWLIAIFAVYTMIKGFLLKDKTLKNFLLGQLVNLPILVGVWFSFFVLIIFIPLPNDRIVNNTPDMVLITTHAHTEYSHDGLMSQERLLKWHQRNGFDAFFITEHNNHNRTLEFVNTRLNQNLPDEPVVFCGEEFSGSNHLSLLGLKTDFSTKGSSDSAVVARARADGAAIIVNHWFSGEHKTPEFYRDLGADGFEIENTGEDKRYNREVYQRIKTLCENSGLIMVGGLDFHGYGSACTLWNAFQIPGWKSMDYRAKEESVLNIIKFRQQEKLKVLLLNDRPYYDRKNLIFSPIITIFNYLRTLNFLQVVSWVGWIFLFALIRFKINGNPAIAQKITCRKLFPVAGIFGAFFLLGLGLVYVFRNQHVEGFTEIYPEYYRLLFLAGGALLVVSGVTAFFRLKKNN